MTMMWVRLDERAPMDLLGFIPEFLEEDDPRPAAEQIDDRYGFGGGWCPMPGFTLLPGDRLKYPGDPVFHPLFITMLRDEIIAVYESSFVMIKQPNGKFEVARMD